MDSQLRYWVRSLPGRVYYLGPLFLTLFDSNYHDGFAAVGGSTIGLVGAVAVFKAILKKLTTWANTSPDRSS